MAQQPLHLHLLHQIVCGLVQVGKAVDLVAGQAGGGGHQLLILGILGQCVGHGHAVDGGTDHRVIHPVVDLLAEHVHPGVQLTRESMYSSRSSWRYSPYQVFVNCAGRFSRNAPMPSLVMGGKHMATLFSTAMASSISICSPGRCRPWRIHGNGRIFTKDLPFPVRQAAALPEHKRR